MGNILTSLDVSQCYEGELPYIKIDGVDNFDIAKIFDCGQCFRFDRVEASRHADEFFGVAFGRAVSVAQDGEKVYIYNATLEDYGKIWRHYLALDADYAAITDDIISRAKGTILESAAEYGRGIRILRQEAWETVCSFIISQNNNIPRIKKLVGAISEKYGKKIDTSGMAEHGATGREYSFPAPDVIAEAGVDAVFALKTGFRAKYIVDAAEKTCGGALDFAFLYECPDIEKCVEHLCRVKGIGRKVASCALLFAFEKYDSFPIDVWIRRVLEKYFPADFTPASLGSYAGIAQQYLFYYERYIV